MEQFLRIGTITNTHGLRGEVKVFPSTDDIRRFSDLEAVFLDEAHGRKKLSVRQARYFKQMVILAFEEIGSIEEAEKIKGCEIFVDREHAVPLEEGEYYYADLIGMKVVTSDGEELGILRDILETGANDVYLVSSKHYGKDIMIPAIESCIKNVDIEEGLMTVELLPGLLEL